MGVAESLGLKLCSGFTNTKQFKTNIKAVDVKNGVKAYLYIISGHVSSGDNSFAEFGIIRVGYSGRYATKYTILLAVANDMSPSAYSSSVSVSEDGYLIINTPNETPNRIQIIG